MQSAVALAGSAGAMGRVLAVDLAPAHRQRLAELGLRPGADVQVVQRTAGGGVVVSVGGGRVALDATTARRITIGTPE